jgi:hypothetical protein
VKGNIIYGAAALFFPSASNTGIFAEARKGYSSPFFLSLHSYPILPFALPPVYHWTVCLVDGHDIEIKTSSIIIIIIIKKFQANVGLVYIGDYIQYV